MFVRKAPHTDRVMLASRVAPRPHAGVAGFDRNHWQLSIGIRGNLRPEYAVEIEGLVRTFGDRTPGTLIALFGSSGHLMIAVVNGRAVDRLHPSIGDQVEVLRQP